jgi:hypothetical protein
VINFNGESVLPETLDALGGCDPPLAEILVIDNASTPRIVGRSFVARFLR